jgi:hypothetical protein
VPRGFGVWTHTGRPGPSAGTASVPFERRAGLPSAGGPAGSVDSSRPHGFSIRQALRSDRGAQQHCLAHIAQCPAAPDRAAAREPPSGAASASRTIAPTQNLARRINGRMAHALYHAMRPLSTRRAGIVDEPC